MNPVYIPYMDKPQFLQMFFGGSSSGKSWKTYKSKNGADHVSMEGKTIRVGDFFEFPDGVKTKCPSRSGEARHDCNCRCFLEYDVMTEEEFAKINANAPTITVTNKIDTGVENPADSGIIQTEGKITGENFTKFELYEKQAEDFYKAMLKSDRDIKIISANTDFSYNEIQEIKNYVMSETHLFADGSVRKFDTDIDIALAWQRLMENRANDTDLLLLNHELVELRYVKKQNVIMKLHTLFQINSMIGKVLLIILLIMTK